MKEKIEMIREFANEDHNNFVENGLVNRIAYLDIQNPSLRSWRLGKLSEYLTGIGIQCEFVHMSKYNSYYHNYKQSNEVINWWNRLLKLASTKQKRNIVKKAISQMKQIRKRNKYFLRLQDILIIQSHSEDKLNSDLKILKKIEPKIKLMNRLEEPQSLRNIADPFDEFNEI